ncbi:MAG: hypothetical protein RMJ43_03240 [Chloroherpetonaceae bacterium]|nr:hypothetical protein [Chloroherpetonaceae bacterium]
MLLRTCVRNLHRHPAEVDLTLDMIQDLLALDVLEVEQTERALRQSR